MIFSSLITGKNTDNRSCFPGRDFSLVWYLVIGTIFLLFRLPRLGHLLSWDEAWNLCTLRSLAGGGNLFLSQFFRHPPLYMELGLLLDPIRAGLDIRMELLSLFITFIALFFFLKMVARFLGTRLAVFSGLAYALLPGPVFFDTWIKSDCLVTLFGSISIWSYLNRRMSRHLWVSAVALGFAFLAKETAFFFAGSIGLIALFGPGKRRWRKLIVLYGITLLIAGWWYVFMNKGGAGFLAFFSGSSEESQGFAMPWWYYFGKLPDDLGWAGMVLFVLGLGAIVPRRTRWETKTSISFLLSRKRTLPVFLLVPGYAVLSLSHGKPPWMTISLYPALALIIGLGWAWAWSWTGSLIPGQGNEFRARFWSGAAALFLVISLLPAMIGFNDPGYFKTIAPKQIGISETAVEMASVVNMKLKDGERLLILPMIYRNGASLLDPVFFWYLTVAPHVYQAAPSINYETLKATIKKEQIHWLLMSPQPGTSQDEMFQGLVGEFDPAGHFLSKTVLLKVDSLWQENGE